VPKRPRTSASKGKPSQKKTRKGSEAATSEQVPVIIPSDIEEQKEEEEEEEAVPAVRPRGSHSRARSPGGSRTYRPICGN